MTPTLAEVGVNITPGHVLTAGVALRHRARTSCSACIARLAGLDPSVVEKITAAGQIATSAKVPEDFASSSRVRDRLAGSGQRVWTSSPDPLPTQSRRHSAPKPTTRRPPLTTRRWIRALAAATATLLALPAAQAQGKGETVKFQDYPGLGNMLVRVAAARASASAPASSARLQFIPAARWARRPCWPEHRLVHGPG